MLKSEQRGSTKYRALNARYPYNTASRGRGLPNFVFGTAGLVGPDVSRKNVVDAAGRA